MTNTNGASAAAGRDNRSDSKREKRAETLADVDREIERHSAGLEKAMRKRRKLLAAAE